MHPPKYYFKESQKLYSPVAFLQSKLSQETRSEKFRKDKSDERQLIQLANKTQLNR